MKNFSTYYLLLFIFFLSNSVLAQLQGEYTIGRKANFTSFTEAIQALQSEGVSGPVTFQVQPGNYQEKLVLDKIPGSGCESPIIFTGPADNSFAVVLQSSRSPVLLVNGPDGITFQNITISGSSRVIYTTNGTRCFTLENSQVIGTGGELVYAESFENIRSNRHVYQNNTFQNGQVGISKVNKAAWNPGSPKFDEGLIIEGNKFFGTGIAISFNGQKDFAVKNNIIKNSFRAISISNSWYGKEISDNKVSEIRVNNYRGGVIHLDSSAAEKITGNEVIVSEGGKGMFITTGKISGEMLIANNILIAYGHDARGINFYPITHLLALHVVSNFDYRIKIFHNWLEVAGYSEYIPIYVLGTDGEVGNYCTTNNVLLNYSNGQIYKYRESTAKTLGVGTSSTCGDYNVEFSTTGFIDGSPNVVNVDARKDYAQLIGAGTYLEEVPYDLNGITRSNPPTIGPYAGVRPAPVSGDYTIGGADGDFAGFQEAAQFLDKYGVKDTVRFSVRPGTYPGPVGFSTEGTLIFAGESGDSSEVEINYPTGSAVTIEKANVVFRHMTIDGIKLSNSSGTFEHNVIRGVNAIGVGELGRTGNHKFHNNKFIEKGIRVENYKERVDGSAEIKGNIMNINSGAGVCLNNINVKNVSGNIIRTNHEKATGMTFQGFHIDLPDQISQNKIVMLKGGVGMEFQFGAYPNVSLINNMITINSHDQSAGISFQEGGYLLYYNTILLYGNGTSGSALLNEYPEITSIQLKNNNLVNLAGGPVLRSSTYQDPYNGISQSDYNNLYTNGDVLVIWIEQLFKNLDQWQSFTSYDLHSLSVDPEFISYDSLIARNMMLVAAGNTIPEVEKDYFGTERDFPPTIGAVENIDQQKPEPSAYAGKDKTVLLPLNQLILSGWGLDPEGRFISYQWEKVSGPGSTLTDANTANLKVNDLQPGVYVFRFTARDQAGNAPNDEVTVTVNSENQPPVVDAGRDMLVTLPKDRIIISGTGKDPDGNFRKFSWEKISGPEVTMQDANTANLKLYDLVAGIYQFRFYATDDDGATASDDMLLTIEAGNNAARMKEITAAAFPNQFTNQINLEIKNSFSETYQVDLYDLNGRTYYHNQFVPDLFNAGLHQMDLSGIPMDEGVYIVRVSNQSGDFQKNFRVIKRGS